MSAYGAKRTLERERCPLWTHFGHQQAFAQGRINWPLYLPPNTVSVTPSYIYFVLRDTVGGRAALIINHKDK